MTPADEVHYLWQRATHETNFRTIASRAYYACFNRCIVYAVSRGFEPAFSGADHGRVRDFMRETSRHPRQPQLLYRIGSTRLPKLKGLRSHADYRTAEEFNRANAAEAVRLMDEIMDLLTGAGAPAA